MGIGSNVSFLEGLVNKYMEGERVPLMTSDSIASEQVPGTGILACGSWERHRTGCASYFYFRGPGEGRVGNARGGDILNPGSETQVLPLESPICILESVDSWARHDVRG